jgi:hypothetical protein
MGWSRAWGVLFLVAVCGCGGDDDGGGTAGGGPDGGGGGMPDGGGADAGDTDAGVTRTIGGSRVTIHVTAGGEQMVPYDLSGAVVEALVDDGAGGYTRYPGQGHADGTFTVAGLPGVTTYMLRVDGVYYVTERDSIDLGGNRLGRPDQQPVTAPTAVTFAVDQLAPWQSTDSLDFFAPNTPSSFPDLIGSADTPPQVDDTSVSFTVDYADAFEPNLVDAAAGDVGYLLRYGHPAGRRRLILTQIFQPATFTMTDGEPTAVTGSFTDVVLDRTALLDLRGSAYQAATSGMAAGELIGLGMSFAIYTSPFSIDRGDLGFIRLAEYNPPDLTDRVRRVFYGHPFPADWTPYENAFAFAVGLLDAEPFTYGVGVIVDSDVEGGLSGGPIAPRLGPVGSPTFDGEDATQPVVGSATPTIAWAPPALGTAELYRVYLRRQDAVAPHGQLVAVFYTAATSLRIPNGLMTAGQSYWVEIDAAADPDADLLAAPYRSVGPRFSLSRRATALFTVE